MEYVNKKTGEKVIATSEKAIKIYSENKEYEVVKNVLSNKLGQDTDNDTKK